MTKKFEDFIQSYLQDKVGISNHFLSLDLSSRLRKKLVGLYSDGLMRDAGIGNTFIQDIDQTIRKDKISWLDNHSSDPSEKEFFALIDQFVSYLNQTCYTGITNYEFHYALYQEGSFYSKHKDQFENDRNRLFSIICYLNKDWQEKDGGLLHIYHNDAVQTIIPLDQRAVFFKSETMEHEVSLSQKNRMSITGWLKR